jgi:sugar phosphate isomerase/epimerase
MISFSTAWNAGRHAGWAPAVAEVLSLGVDGVALDGPALQSDAAEAARVRRAAKRPLVALFAPAPVRDPASPVAAGGLVAVLADGRTEALAPALAAALAAGRAALVAGTDVVVLRPGTIPVLDGGREDRWVERLAREGLTDALAAEVAAAAAALVPDRPRFLEALCRSVWNLSRALPDVTWCVESPVSLAGLPFPAEIESFLSELRGRKAAFWLDTAHAARLGALGAADPREWIARAGGAVRGVTISDWAPPAFGGGGGAGGGRLPPGAGLVDWASLRGQMVPSMSRVLRLPPEVPPALAAEALREAERRVG